MSNPSSTGTGVSPAAPTVSAWPGGQATRTSCPAARSAQARGTIGNQWPGQPDTVTSTRMRLAPFRSGHRSGHQEAGQQPAVDDHLGTGDVGGVRAGEEGDQRADLGGPTEAAQRKGPGQPSGDPVVAPS